MKRFLKRVSGLITNTAAGKIRNLPGKILTLPQALAKKLADISKAAVKTVAGKPTSIKDYVPMSDVYVSKRLVFMAVAVTAATIFFVAQYALPYLEGKLWIPSIVINTVKFHTYKGNAKVVSPEGELIYAGGLIRGEITGTGVLYDGARLVYEGGFSENNFDGSGRLYYPNREPKFEGVFENGSYKEGKLFYESGSLCFDGLFDGNQYKEGKLYSENGGLIYEGGFKDSLYDGLGKEYDNGRLKYEGEFSGGVYDGAGKLYNGSFIVYDGNFREGLFDGSGKLYAYRSDRILYEGGFSSGSYDGIGTLYFANSGRELYSGEFTAGRYNGEGVLYDARGRTLYTGAFYMGEIDYVPFIDADTELVRTAFGTERSLEILENSFMLYYDGMNVLFEFSFADEESAPMLQKIKLLGGQRVYGVKNGMPVTSFKRHFSEEIFTEYYFNVSPEDETSLFLAGSTFAEGDEIYCVKYDLDSVYIRAFAESENGNVIYYEIGGV